MQKIHLIGTIALSSTGLACNALRAHCGACAATLNRRDLPSERTAETRP